ncbi:MAG: PLDc_N domain-containing protein [Candidatus Moraniibacteriota bacterium]|nr:MAG: PLDc_N domain-containing protein [Candidatus Moranbacteria bacterium]
MDLKYMLKMKKNVAIFSFLILALFLVTNNISLAASQCTVNGSEVPCEALKNQVKGVLGLGLGIGFFLLIFGAFGIFSLIFWILMIVHIAKHNIQDKAMWMILVVFTGFIGALVYYFAVKRTYKESSSSVITTSSNTSSTTIPPREDTDLPRSDSVATSIPPTKELD